MSHCFSVSKVLSCVNVPRGKGCYDQKCSVNLLCLIRGKSICTYCPASETCCLAPEGRGRERERELWLEEYACEWGNKYIAKDGESEIIQYIGRELGHLHWKKI